MPQRNTREAYFFFSSRRRHTRWPRDWSSDVCSSDLKKILDQEGIENRVFDYAPGRANLWARIPHTTADTRRPIILLNHMDVVTSDASHWKVPPFSGAILGGSMYGRGAQDMKDEGLAQL